MQQEHSLAPSIENRKAIGQYRDEEEENDNNVIGLMNSFDSSCDIRSIGFLKESPIQDDNYEGWFQTMTRHPNYKKRYSASRVLELSGASLTYEKERNAILNFISDENGITGIVQFVDGQYSSIFNSEFIEIIKNDLEFHKISILTPTFKRVGMDLRDYLYNFKSSSELMNRDDIFRYRLKWIVPLSESDLSSYTLLHFDSSFEFDDVKINVDICLESVTRKRKLFIVFSHSNLDDAFNSEEFYKMIALSLLSITYHKSTDRLYYYFEPSVLICCRTYAHYFSYYRSSINVSIRKIDLQTFNGIMILFFLISNFFSGGQCERVYSELKEKESVKIKNINKNSKGIQKSNKMISNRKIENEIFVRLRNIKDLK